MKQAMERLEEILEIGGTKRDIAFLIISGASLLASIFGWQPLPFNIAWIAIILCGLPIVAEAVIGLIARFDIKADVLVSIALVASVIIGEIFAAGEVAFIMQLGALLEDLTVSRARAGIERLVHLTPRTARIVDADGTERVVPAEEVAVGDILRVNPGETIPVDGVLISGSTLVGQASMTGESMPVSKSVGDELLSGTINQYGAFDMRAEKVGEDSSIQRMIRLVQSADAGKAKIVGIADRWATWIVVAALTSAAITWLVSGEIIRAVTILVVFCPCALVLATPTAIMAAIGNSTKHGFLVREGDALERLAEVCRVAFDKTGTLTFGKPVVERVESLSDSIDRDELFALAASAESRSEHPLGKAIVESFRVSVRDAASSGDDLEDAATVDPVVVADDFEMIPGKGIVATCGGERVLAGNASMLESEGISIPEAGRDLASECMEKGSTVVFIARGGEALGLLSLSDQLRPKASSTIAEIRDSGSEPVLLTGDNERAAGTIAASIGISEMRARCLPEDKMAFITDSEDAGKRVCMIGDGINDAPALKSAHVGIAMGNVGSDIAVDAADIVLVDDDISELPHLLRLARRMMITIKCNMAFSLGLNFIAIVLAIMGILNPVAGALVHNAGSIFVIVNSAFLLGWKGRAARSQKM